MTITETLDTLQNWFDGHISQKVTLKLPTDAQITCKRPHTSERAGSHPVTVHTADGGRRQNIRSQEETQYPHMSVSVESRRTDGCYVLSSELRD